MNVSSINSIQDPYQLSAQQTRFRQRAEDFKALASALQSGDLTGAQQAFATLVKDMPGAAQANSNANSAKPTSKLSQDFQTLQTALQSGDLSNAQHAFATLQQDLQGAGKAHRHHHHQPSSTETSTNSSQAAAISTSAPATNLNQLV